MYVCNVLELKLEGGRVAKRDEPIPEADAWAPNILKANLQWGYIRLAVTPPAHSGHPAAVRVSSVLSPEQKLRRDSAPPWLLKEASKGRILPLEPGPSEDHHSGPVTLTAGQGPSPNTRQVDEADPIPAPPPEPRHPVAAPEPELAEKPVAGGRNRRNGRR
jgi:hypothetical protein